MAAVCFEIVCFGRCEEISRSSFGLGVSRSGLKGKIGGTFRYRMNVLNVKSAEDVRMQVPSGDLKAISS